MPLPDMLPGTFEFRFSEMRIFFEGTDVQFFER